MTLNVIQGGFGAANTDAPKKSILELITAALASRADVIPPEEDLDATFVLIVRSDEMSSVISNEESLFNIIGAMELAKASVVKMLIE